MSETSNELNQDYRDLLQCLCSEEVDFLVVGAYAVAFHGTPRATGDIDLLVRPTVENAGRAQDLIDLDLLQAERSREDG